MSVARELCPCNDEIFPVSCSCPSLLYWPGLTQFWLQLSQSKSVEITIVTSHKVGNKKGQPIVNCPHPTLSKVQIIFLPSAGPPDWLWCSGQVGVYSTAAVVSDAWPCAQVGRYPAFSLVQLLHCCALIGRELQSVEIFSCMSFYMRP